MREAEKVAQNLYICPPTFSQYAALAAFDTQYLCHARDTYRQRRDYLYGELSKLFTVELEPAGAFYVWADVSRHAQDSREFADLLLQKLYDRACNAPPFCYKNPNLSPHCCKISGRWLLACSAAKERHS